MKKYIVDYDLLDEDADYDALKDSIKSLGVAARIAKSSWFLTSNRSAKDIRDFLEKQIDGENRLFVAELNGDCACYNIEESAKVKLLISK